MRFVFAHRQVLLNRRYLEAANVGGLDSATRELHRSKQPVRLVFCLSFQNLNYYSPAVFDDIFLLSNGYADLLGCDAVGLRLELLDNAMCPRFHGRG
ncbi:DUF1826 domain-containing protein [Nitrosovibrio tenuis]|uniref:Uncharacterized protein n=1 Tax=Nitrosovibrio tenuis TaxID=1233 RepID=A0A1H7NPT9_9PROT|nr:DUF1826 domain-containing protein [Nitrosovibrio tenuis]SEL25466.1 Protein of unknown function [Nitrosovibrio tenuis]